MADVALSATDLADLSNVVAQLDQYLLHSGLTFSGEVTLPSEVNEHPKVHVVFDEDSGEHRLVF